MPENPNRKLASQIAWLLTHNQGFLEDFAERIEPEYFGNIGERWLVRLALQHYANYGEPLPEVALEHALDEGEDSGELEQLQLEAEDIVELWETMEPVKKKDLNYFKKIAEDFCKHQGMNLALRQAANVLKDEGPEAAWQIMSQARDGLRIEEPSGMSWSGEDVIDALRQIEEHEREMITIATGMPKLDDYMGGGLRLGEFACYVTPTGFGKCHAKGQGILMFDGTVRLVEDIVVEDQLMGPDSKPRNVLALGRGREAMRRIVPTKGQPFVVTAGHMLTLIRTNDGTSLAGKQIDISVEDWEKKSATFKHVHKLVRSGAEFSIHSLPPPMAPYLLGLWLGDGGTGIEGHYARFTNIEPEILTYLNETAMSYDLSIKAHGQCSYSLTTGTHGRHNSFSDAVRTCGLWGKTCSDKFIPNRYKTGSRSERLEILAGLIDTDGSRVAGGGYDFISKSRKLADDVAFIARSLDLAAYVTPCQKSSQNGTVGQYYRVGLSGDLSVIPCRVPRKISPPRLQKKNVLCTGFCVERLPEADYYGFVLDGDHRYLLDDFTVTHNTMFLCQLAAVAVTMGITVVYYTLETEKEEITLRTLASATSARIDDIRAYAQASGEVARRIRMSKDSPADRVTAMRKALRRMGHSDKKLLIRDITTRGATLNYLIADFHRLQREGNDPKLMIIDYADRLRPNGRFEQRWQAEEEMYKEIQFLAKDLNIGIWTAAQSGRRALQRGKPQEGSVRQLIGPKGLEDIAGAYNKTFEASYVIVGQQIHKKNDEGVFWMAKTRRSGSRGKGFEVRYDFSRSRFYAADNLSPHDLSYDDTSAARSYQPDNDMENDYGDDE